MRKVVDGEVRNKERTKFKLIEAVGTIILNEGYSKLGVNNIARKALVDKKLIYRYFGSVDELIASYFRKRDFWLKLNESIFDKEDIKIDDFGEELAKSALSSLIDSLEIHEETRKILLWEISEKNNDNLKKLSLERELLGEELFQISDPLFEHSNIDLRACFSLLLAGVYYLT